MTKPSTLRTDAEDHAADLTRKVQATARAKAEEHAQSLKDSAAAKAENTANAAKAAAAQFDPATLQAEAAQHVADRVDELAARIRHSDLETVASQVGDFARRNPLLFVGAAAAAGFAATRFLKAREPHATHHDADDPWSATERPTVISEINKERRHG